MFRPRKFVCAVILAGLLTPLASARADMSNGLPVRFYPDPAHQATTVQSCLIVSRYLGIMVTGMRRNNTPDDSVLIHLIRTADNDAPLNDAPLWNSDALVSLTYYYGNIREYLHPQYESHEEQSGFVETLSSTLSLDSFRRIVASGKFYVTINGATNEVRGQQLAGFRQMLTSLKGAGSPRPSKVPPRVASPRLRRLSLTRRQRNATSAALTALRKIKAATEVGINFAGYNSLVVSAQAKVNEASRTLSQTSLRNELKEAVRQYVLTGNEWKARLDLMNMGGQSDSQVTDSLNKVLRDSGRGQIKVGSLEDELRAGWMAASPHILRAEQLSGL